MDLTILERLTAALADRYRLEREIGRGGMATVFLAEDLKHQRRVALKVLHPELGAVLGADRFLAEVRTTANLQHPNILPLFDSGSADGLVFYVMPFIEGETLRDRLEREGQLPITDAVRLSQGIAAALDYAHRHGVIHRDIKPENILLQDGQALVADFGVALAVSNAGGQRITQTGISVGTPAYMSPEQAAAERQIDGRSDQYSLAAILYEMIAGEAPFTGPTVAAIMTRMMTEAPKPLEQRRASVPDYIAAAVHRAMEKVPADRYATASEFAQALEKPGTGTYRRPEVQAPRRPWRDVAFAAVALLLAAGAWYSGRGAAPKSPVPVMRFDVTLPPNTTLANPGALDVPSVAVSPDGRYVVYVGKANSRQPMLYLHDLASNTVREIPGSERGQYASFSPDGSAIAFINDPGAIVKYQLTGAAPTVVYDGRPIVANLAWVNASTLVFSTGEVRQGLWAVPSDGGKPTKLTDVSTGGAATDRAPFAAADGKSVFFVRLMGGGTNSVIGNVPITGGTPTLFANTPAQFVVGVVGNRVVYVRLDGALMAVALDVAKGVAGRSEAIADSVGVGKYTAAAASSANGVAAYIHGRSLSQLSSVSMDGIATPVSAESRSFAHPRYSPDGKRIAYEAQRVDGSDIWVYSVGARTFLRLTDRGYNERPEWTKDGKELFYLSTTGGTESSYSVWRRKADASDAGTQVLGGSRTVREVMPAPDLRSIVYREDVADGVRDIFQLDLAPGAKPRVLAGGPADQYMPRLSPDGQLMAYLSNESGREEIYVRSMTSDEGRLAISNEGGREPIWAPDGTRLFYREGRKLIAVTLATRPALAITGRAVVFEGNFTSGLYHGAYDVAPDGRSFLMLKSEDDARKLSVILNWPEELRRRSAGKP